MGRTLFFVCIFGLLIGGCTDRQASNKAVSGAPAPPNNNSKPTDRRPPNLRVQTSPKGHTSVYQSDFKILQPILLDGKSVEGTHHIELWNTATYDGSKKACIADSLAVMIKHEKPIKSGWQFPTSAKVSVVIDGEVMKPIKVIQQGLELEDGTFWESLITQPSCEMIAKLGSGKAAEIRIDNASIRLSDYELTAFKEFGAALALK